LSQVQVSPFMAGPAPLAAVPQLCESGDASTGSGRLLPELPQPTPQKVPTIASATIS
jgi:hypothetical protein